MRGLASRWAALWIAPLSLLVAGTADAQIIDFEEPPYQNPPCMDPGWAQRPMWTPGWRPFWWKKPCKYDAPMGWPAPMGYDAGMGMGGFPAPSGCGCGVDQGSTFAPQYAPQMEHMQQYPSVPAPSALPQSPTPQSPTPLNGSSVPTPREDLQLPPRSPERLESTDLHVTPSIPVPGLSPNPPPVRATPSYPPSDSSGNWQTVPPRDGTSSLQDPAAVPPPRDPMSGAGRFRPVPGAARAWAARGDGVLR